MRTLFLLVGGGLTGIWGIAHLFPIRGVARGFGEISTDNRRIVVMEWIMEGVLLIFVGVVVFLAALLGSPLAALNQSILLAAAGVLVVMALVSLFTGARIRFLPFRLCPVIFTLSALLILAAALFIH